MVNQRRIAMWSGPRNISTALLRSWGNREDTFVCDEPFYAHYLQQTGIKHPGRDEIIASQSTDWREVVAELTGEIPEGKSIYYQKQMAHHLLPNIERDWLDSLTHCFLIRDPREMITSLIKVLPNPTVEETGLPQQLEIFQKMQQQTGSTPPVIDTKDVLDNPEEQLRLLCDAIGINFTEKMLSWEAGKRKTDGIWAKHWYAQVESSTRFRPFKPKPDVVPDSLQSLYDECCEIYEQLYQHRLGQK